MSKKQMKQYITAIVALIICIAGYFLVNHYCQVKKQEAEQESLKATEENTTVIYEMEDVSVITGFSYILDGTTLNFTKDDSGTWKNRENPDLKLDGDTIESTLLTKLMEISSDNVIEQPEDVSQYGFDSPTNVITVMESDGSSHTFTIGSQNEFDTSKYYLMMEGDDNVYVVDSTLSSAFSAELEEFEEEETTVEATTTMVEDSDTEE